MTPLRRKLKKGRVGVDCMLRVLNGWFGAMMMVCITGAFGDPGANDNGRRVVDFCAKRWLCVFNTYFDCKSLHEYTRMTRGEGGVEVISMIDLVLVKKDMLCYVHNVKAVREMGQDISDHQFALCEVRFGGIMD